MGFFKYANFFLSSANTLGGPDIVFTSIILPLGISFFTFQQVSYLVDVYRGQPVERDLLGYAFFVTFFPQLIAGPIVHHREILPQVHRAAFMLTRSNVAVGLSIFSAGLFKKVVLADGLAGSVGGVFDAAAAGGDPTLFAAWGGALAFTLQLYFDFSGYSEMAIGLGRLFGIRLPQNFDSPYQARNISEF